MNTPITFDDLDHMAAEVLPERTVLSTVLSSCQSTTTYTEPGLAGVLGLGFNATPVQTMSCTPAAVVS